LPCGFVSVVEVPVVVVAVVVVAELPVDPASFGGPGLVVPLWPELP
jgi:hypothetical protein